MIRFFIRLIPWWMYVAIGLLFAPLSAEFFEQYTTDQAQLEGAISNGPPRVVPISSFRAADVAALGEVHLSGVIRPDLGITEIETGTIDHTFVVIGATSTSGPLVALVVPETQSDQMIDMLLASASQDGSVEVQGLLRTTNRSDVRAALARQGEQDAMILVEPFLGNRPGALREKAQDSLIVFGISAAFTAVFFLAGAFKFWSWRKRRAPRSGQGRTAALAPRPEKVATQKAQPKRAGLVSPQETPWEMFKPATNASTPTVKPQAMPAKASTPKAGARKSNDNVAMPEPEFTSVFPGGGSGFRFKSADEIIRKSFGTLSVLSKPIDRPEK